ncbi:hypothetical protein F5B22DRAFT_529407 [Xylaria bambusicola]|uniref:uncharacterized protein n=1 Tax=Xylaria bambusicola TaxID=326684 RepID=UPI002008A621|nr:uncharacterized protein F5B22DRAFT_529407 [Xylaria bambusicola]KAI0505352.1 hypothetical protein F5B22DRAFT_529407 [Xylaria bambusicola]
MDPQIHEWQKAVLPNPDEEAIGIAKVFSDCSDLWGAITQILAQQQWIQKGTIRKLKSAHSYIYLWADGYGVPSGKFEERLKNSQRAGDLTIRLLQNICRTLTHELTPVVTCLSTVSSEDITRLLLTAADLALTSERLAVLVQGDNDSDSSEDGEAVAPSESVPHEKLLDDIADDLRSDAQCLLDLGSRFEEQVMNPIASEAAANPSSSFDGRLCDTFIERIIRFYPQCESNLAGRLGEANWLRFLKIAGLKPRASDDRAVQDKDIERVNYTPDSDSVEFRSIVDDLSIRGQSLFHDSGLGTASHVSASHLDTNESGPTRNHPPLPEGAIQGKPFHCIACKDHVTITTEDEWRKHLLRDIEPYVCPVPECGAPPFPSVKLLERHMSISHAFSTIWRDSRCRICGKDVNTRLRIILHLADHMEAIALSIVPQDPGIEVHKALATDSHENNEVATPSSNPEDSKILRATRAKVKTGCNQCKMRRIKCDEQVELSFSLESSFAHFILSYQRGIRC